MTRSVGRVSHSPVRNSTCTSHDPGDVGGQDHRQLIERGQRPARRRADPPRHHRPLDPRPPTTASGDQRPGAAGPRQSVPSRCRPRPAPGQSWPRRRPSLRRPTATEPPRLPPTNQPVAVPVEDPVHGLHQHAHEDEHGEEPAPRPTKPPEDQSLDADEGLEWVADQNVDDGTESDCPRCELGEPLGQEAGEGAKVHQEPPPAPGWVGHRVTLGENDQVLTKERPTR